MNSIKFEAGRKLDKLIAIKIMGWMERTDGSIWEPGRRQDAPVHNVPHYSTEIADAWKVEEIIEKLRLMVPYAEFLKLLCKVSETDVPMTFDLVHASPFLRCMAALEAVEYRERETDKALRNFAANL